ncbi:lasso peptide biosynthesis B2 protein [Rhodobacteraceae bacterium NNCM2]|nr:lasso peptide biosynthesis B2 protein [Coraliihabitans acroporae]
MRPLVWWRAWRKTPWSRRKLALEAGAELARARALTLLPPSVYTKTLGTLAPAQARPDLPHETALAEELGAIVRTVAAGVPFRALCLQQVIALRRMLTRRGCAPVIVLGVRPEDISDAHAWLKVGSTVVSGDGELERFSALAEFR